MSESICTCAKFDSHILVLSICVHLCMMVFVNVMKAESSIFLGIKVGRRDGFLSNHFLLLSIIEF